MKKKERLIRAAIFAQKAGIAPTFSEWAKFSKKEKKAWLAAKVALAMPAPSTRSEVETENRSGIEDDFALEEALRRGADLVAERAG